jgi:prepilin-type N-terminal cleavage/methylation domain-containing protein
MSTGDDISVTKVSEQKIPANLHLKSSHNGAVILQRPGFSLIEVLIVLLVMGVLCAAGISIYAGVTGDTQTRTRQDQLESFFSACRNRALMRKIPVAIRFANGILSIDQSKTLQLRVPDLLAENEKTIEGLSVATNGQFMQNNSVINELRLSAKSSANRVSTIRIKL